MKRIGTKKTNLKRKRRQTSNEKKTNTLHQQQQYKQHARNTTEIERRETDTW